MRNQIALRTCANAIALAIAAGCGGPDDAAAIDAPSAGDSGPGVDAGGPDGSSDVLVNGKPASEYYGQFTWDKTNSALQGAAAFPAQPDGRDVFLVTFFLMPDHTFELFYLEGTGEASPTNWVVTEAATDAKKRRSGTWAIEGAELVLGSYLRCGGATLTGHDALSCTLTTPITTTAAQDQTATCWLWFHGAPDDQLFADYVP